MTGRSTDAHAARLVSLPLLPPLSVPALRRGARDIVPLTLGIAIWGLVTGVAMVRGGIPLGWSIAIGLVAYAGSAQLAVLPLVVTHAPIPIVFLTATLVNLRFMIFSAAMRGDFAHLPRRKRVFAAYLNGDFSFTLCRARFTSPAHAADSADERMGYFWGVASVNFIAWNASSTVGMLLGSGLPASWGLDLAATLALMSVAIPLLAGTTTDATRSRMLGFVRRPAVAGALTTAVCSVALVRLPYRLGLVGSMLAGIAVALVLERAHPAVPA